MAKDKIILQKVAIYSYPIQNTFICNFISGAEPAFCHSDNPKVMVWGRSEEKLARYKSVMMAKGFTVETTFNTEENCK